MKLYTYFRSSAAFRARIALNYKGLAYEPALVSLAKNEHHESAYRRINPQGLLPALVDDGHRLIQSLAIMEYLEERYPEPPLLPKDPFDRAYVRALSDIVACEIHPLNNPRTLKHVRKSYGVDEPGINAWYRHWIAEGFGMLEGFLRSEARSGTYCLGDTVTMADCCLVPQVFNAKRYECDLGPFPTAMRIFDACMKLAAFDAAQPSKQPDAT
ncbi:MAG: maleylacetoacetate isomerase [Betaproteobacteria bacterium]|jgi:maleylacetoacetate isomerase/maleylpyruvate isomerase|nr:maleylacetoacetate isomerase [Betaproteobacteria bacterium]